MALDKVPGQDLLYIGGIFALRRQEALQRANITHVLSVLRQPIDERLFGAFAHQVIEVDDVDDENLLEHFPRANAFIQGGLDNGGGVLVHCAMGKSRSATCVIAYMMHQHGLTPDGALSRLRESRPLCEPNTGFMEQLKLYQQMKCPSNLDDEPIYQRWLYQREVEISVACGQAPENVRFEDEQETQDVDHDRQDAEYDLRCRKCRCVLATSRYLAQHPPKATDTVAEEESENAHEEGGGAAINRSSTTSPNTCSHYFLEPLSWMREELEQGRLDGRLECPKCKSNIGKYAWQGMKCSCGAWIVPGISISRGRVDEAKDIRQQPPDKVEPIVALVQYRTEQSHTRNICLLYEDNFKFAK